jgi:hypothetical protein
VFVRRVTTRSKGAASGVSYRLVHSQRLGPHKIRQLVLAYFPAGLEQRVPKPHWKRLAAAIKDLLAGQAALPADPDQDPSQQALAERIAAEAEAATPLVRRRLRDADCATPTATSASISPTIRSPPPRAKPRWRSCPPACATPTCARWARRACCSCRPAPSACAPA